MGHEGKNTFWKTAFENQHFQICLSIQRKAKNQTAVITNHARWFTI